MAVSLENANTYFHEEVFLNDAWVDATKEQQSRALKNAENQLYRFYTNFDKHKKPLPDHAVYEQAYFLMLVDETIQKAQHGVTQVSISGISISTNAVAYPISPEVKMIVLKETGATGGVRLGRTAL